MKEQADEGGLECGTSIITYVRAVQVSSPDLMCNSPSLEPLNVSKWAID